MLRKMISLSLFAAVVGFAASGLVNADCATCNGGGVIGGYANGCGGGCPGGCAGKLLGGLHQEPSGPCMTCDNLWDDYCASKKSCLPQAKYPFQNKGCHGCAGGCAGCNTCAGGVGLYGKCATGGCASGHCGVGLLGNLFKSKRLHAACADGGCSDAGCSTCASSGAITAAPAMGDVMQSPAAYHQPAATHTHATPAYSQPAINHSQSIEAPMSNEAAPVAPSPSDVPAAMPAAPPLPAAPSATDQSNRGSGAFDWLQQALRP